MNFNFNIKKLILTLLISLTACLSVKAEDIIWEFGENINAELIEYLNENPQYRSASIGIDLAEGHNIELYFCTLINKIRESSLKVPETNRYILLDGNLFPVYFYFDFALYISEEDREINKTVMYPSHKRVFFLNEGEYFLIDPYHDKIKKLHHRLVSEQKAQE